MREMRSGFEIRAGRARAVGVVVVFLLALHTPLQAQAETDSRQILDRLDRLEKQNQALTEEIRQLRAQLSALQAAASPAAVAATEPQAPAAPASSTEDAMAIQQARLDEQAQSKVEAAHKLPIQITGMALFNSFYDTHADSGLYSGTAASTTGPAAAGGTLSQSIIGLEFQSPSTVFGAQVHGDLYVDFFGSTSNSSGYGAWPMPRLRTGTVSVDWDSSSIMVGVDKPLISPYTPDSFAQVGVPPLSGSGNLWYWEPQARLERRIKFSDDTTLRLQASLIATHETATYVPSDYASTLAPTRPGWEGRLALNHRTGEDTFINIGTGFHFSETHVAGQSVTSDLFSVDGRLHVARWWDITGTMFTGENLNGLGGSGQGFAILSDQTATAVHSTGGWMQLTLSPTERLSFHLFGGAQNNQRADLWNDAIYSNAAYAGNVYYQLAPNIFAAFEAARTRTDWTVSGLRLRNQYDLSLAYLF